MLWKLLSLLTIPALLIPSGVCFCEVSARACNHNHTPTTSSRCESAHAAKSRCGHSHHKHENTEQPEQSEPVQHQHSDLPTGEHEPHCPIIIGTIQAIRGETDRSTSVVSLITSIDDAPASILTIGTGRPVPRARSSDLSDGPPIYLSLLTLLI